MQSENMEDANMGKNGLGNDFLNPPQEFGPAPFWFLNERLDEKELSWQIRQMKEKGLSGYVMHARYGLEVPYLSEEWFAKIGHIVRESEKYGMDAIIYDEYDWPSGMSGTRVLDDHPEYILTYLDISLVRCEEKKSLHVPLEDGNVVAIFGAQYEGDAHEQRDFNFKVKNLKDLREHAEEGVLAIDNCADIDIVFCFIEKELLAYHPKTAFPQPVEENCPFHQPHGWDWYFPYGKYVDLFNPDAVDYFIETTHEEYKKRFKGSFGGAISKVFTDEPGFYTIMREGASAMPWSRIFPDEFRKEYGYSIVDSLPALVSNIGEKTATVRHDFWEKLTNMFVQNYVKRCADWCDRNGLQLIGHFRLCNPFLMWQMVYQGNAIPGMAQMHIPGVDALDNVEGDLNLRWGIDEDVWQIESKLVSSVGHHYGKRRVMSESFALGGWKYRMENMKILADWQYMMGINFMVPHAFHYSISAQRKRECPPSEFYQNPMWDNYKYFSDYLSRLGVMMIDAVHVADIALLYPIESLWAEYVSGTVERFPWDISDDFSYITDRLLRLNLDYNILGQDSLAGCTIENGKLRIRNQQYSIVIMPPMTTLRDESAKKIMEFLDAGGKVLVLSMLPYKNNNGKPLGDFTSYFEKAFGVRTQELVSDYRARVGSTNLIERNGTSLLQSGPLFLSDSAGSIGEAVGRLIERDFAIRFSNASQGNVYYSHWRKEGKEIYFIVNSDERPYEVEIELRGKGIPSIWNPETGEQTPAYCYTVEENGKLTLPLKLQMLQSIFVVLDSEESEPGPRIVATNTEILSVEKTGVKVINKENTGLQFVDFLDGEKPRHCELDIGPDMVQELGDRWIIHRNKPNVLVLNRWQVTQGFTEGVGWFNMLGGTVTWETHFSVEGHGGDLRAVFDRIPEPNSIEINGTTVERFRNSTFLDHQMQECDLRRIVKEGDNVIKIFFELPERAFQGKTGIQPIELMFDPVMIIGDFVLLTGQQKDEYVISPERGEIHTGSWGDQGYPFFTGDIEYRQHIYLDAHFLQGRHCFLEAENVREIAELHINGSRVGVRPWRPHTWDITGELKTGMNDIQIRVWNTLTNLLDLKNIDSGIVGNVRIVSKEVKTAAAP
jgi:hypothetical protein